MWSNYCNRRKSMSIMSTTDSFRCAQVVDCSENVSEWSHTRDWSFFCQCLHYFMYIMSKPEAHIRPHKEELTLCVLKCERTWDKDISCVCSLLSETLIRPPAERFPGLSSCGHVCLFSWVHVVCVFSFTNIVEYCRVYATYSYRNVVLLMDHPVSKFVM